MARTKDMTLLPRGGFGLERQADWEAEVKLGSSNRTTSFSPCGRRWREAPDEGFSPHTLFCARGKNPSPVSNELRSFDPPSPTRGEGRRGYVAAVVTPPSTTMVWPVMKVEASDAR